MLILSRRESEKVLFPKLGITIEVTRVQGRTVRLGIDAPDEIRIIRGELEQTADWNVRPNPNQDNDRDAPQNIRQCLDAANLAIHLAQNQLRQQLCDRAEVALEHAIESIENLEKAVGLSPSSFNSTPVREASAGYSLARRKNAICVNFDPESGRLIGNRLKELGYLPTLIDSGKSLIEYLNDRRQPNLILTMRERFCTSSFDEVDDFSEHQNECGPGLRMFGVGSLQKSKRIVEFADAEITSWFVEPEDAAIVDECFQL